MRNALTCQIHSYSQVALLDNLANHHIVVYEFKILNDNDFLLTIPLTDEKKIKKLYKDVKILRHQGFLGRLKRLFVTRISLVALFLASLFFVDLTSRVSSINVIGTNRHMNAEIALKAEELGLKKMIRKPKYSQLLEIENSLKQIYVDKIDFVEVRLNGCVISIKYQMRKAQVEVPELGEAKYATKNGIIAYYVLKNGVKMVEENQYVTAGTMLVNDKIVTADGEEITIGAYGQVYARTWTIVEVSVKEEDESEAFLAAIQKAKELMCAGFYLDEKILSEKVLLFEKKDNDEYFLKIHFTCLEDIGN